MKSYVPPSRRAAIAATAPKQVTTEELQDNTLFPVLGARQTQQTQQPSVAAAVAAEKSSFKKIMEDRVRQEQEEALRGKMELSENPLEMTPVQLEKNGYVTLKLGCCPGFFPVASSCERDTEHPDIKSLYAQEPVLPPSLFEAARRVETAAKYEQTLQRCWAATV